MAEKNEETPENIQEEVAEPRRGARPPKPLTRIRSRPLARPPTRAPAPVTRPPPEARGSPRLAAERGSAAEAKPKAAPRSGPTPRARSSRPSAPSARRRAAAASRARPRSATPSAASAVPRVAKQRRAYRQRLKTKKAEARKAAPPREADHAPEHGPGRAKVRQGVVVSEKGEKTITVAIDVVRRHKRYHKIMRSTVKLYAHDERNDAHEGDTVRVQECRPMSRTKRWRLVEVLERAK